MTHHERDSLLRTPIGEVVKAWRKARGFTATELVARAGPPITKGYLTQLEHEKIQRPSDKFLAPLAAALEIPDEYLLLRRLPDETNPDTQQQREEREEEPLIEDEEEEESGGFIFASPQETPRRLQHRHIQEGEQLRNILLHIEELRRMVNELIKQHEV